MMTTVPPRTLALRPFRAIRYRASTATELGNLISPPYDVIDDEERTTLAARNAHNVVRLILPSEPAEGGLDRYTSAAELLDEWLDEGILAVDDEPALYVYQQRTGETVLQRGLFGAIAWRPLDAGVILPHENVQSGPVEDRLALMRAMHANPEPIFLLYDGGGAASDIATAAVTQPALQSAETPDGVTHELWAVTDLADLARIEADLSDRQAMIADGHHRYTTYGYLRDEMHATRENGPWDFGLTLLVDDSVATPDIRAIHRVVPAFALGDAVKRAAFGFQIRELDTISDVDSALIELAKQHGPAYVITDGDQFVLLSDPDSTQLAASKPTERTSAWWQLDASIASVFLMEHLWGVTDAAGQVDAEHDPHAAIRIARETAGIALLLNPAPLAGILAVARAGDAMPRKSTLFLPKPASGFVMRAFRFEES
jgi:uncharacterized protein (DUF1015 family)